MRQNASDAADYEAAVEAIFAGLLRIDGLLDATVRRDVILQGLVQPHQIDVLWEFDLAGTRYSTIVEAKNWHRYVGVREVRDFKGVIDDLPSRPRGVMVSRNGFQRGARRFAESHGIHLYKLCPAAEASEGPLLAWHEVGTNVTSTCTALELYDTQNVLLVRVRPSRSASGDSIWIVGNGVRRPLRQFLDLLQYRAMALQRETIEDEFEPEHFVEDDVKGTRYPLGFLRASFKRHEEPRLEERDLRKLFSSMLSGLVDGETVLVGADDALHRIPHGQQLGMCDFCGDALFGNGRLFLSGNIAQPFLLEHAEFASQVSTPEWVACDACAEAIEAWDDEKLVQRHVEMGARVRGAKPAELARGIHALFWLGYLKRQCADAGNFKDPAFLALARRYEQYELDSMAAIDEFHGAQIVDSEQRHRSASWPALHRFADRQD